MVNYREEKRRVSAAEKERLAKFRREQRIIRDVGRLLVPVLRETLADAWRDGIRIQEIDQNDSIGIYRSFPTFDDGVWPMLRWKQERLVATIWITAFDSSKLGEPAGQDVIGIRISDYYQDKQIFNANTRLDDLGVSFREITDVLTNTVAQQTGTHSFEKELRELERKVFVGRSLRLFCAIFVIFVLTKLL